jgi:predicted nuclease of predicted toxin-antitoxin system
VKFLVDECVGRGLTDWLRHQGYDVISVREMFPGVSDQVVLHKATFDGRIVITSDKDFGEMIFRDRSQHCGIILLRLADERPANKIRVIEQLLKFHTQDLSCNFIVATELAVRVIKGFFH